MRYISSLLFGLLVMVYPFACYQMPALGFNWSVERAVLVALLFAFLVQQVRQGQLAACPWLFFLAFRGSFLPDTLLASGTALAWRFIPYAMQGYCAFLRAFALARRMNPFDGVSRRRLVVVALFLTMFALWSTHTIFVLGRPILRAPEESRYLHGFMLSVQLRVGHAFHEFGGLSFLWLLTGLICALAWPRISARRGTTA